MGTREERAKQMVAYLKKAYPKPKSELRHATNFQFLVAVIMSAQCTDKKVNECTSVLFKKYRTARDFAQADLPTFRKEISSIPFFNNKAKHIIASAKIVDEQYGGRVPKTVAELVTLPGVAYKTANVVLGELYDVWEGIPTDTHVRRFALRFELTKEKDLTKISKDLEKLIPKPDWKYVNNGLVLYGRYVCPVRPHDCALHPLTKIYPKANTLWPESKE